jgi:DNA invertase Pin-like site-specific DNA recombinase
MLSRSLSSEKSYSPSRLMCCQEIAEPWATASRNASRLTASSISSGVLETLQYLRTLTSYGVGWKSFTEQYLDSCGIFRDAVLSILATIAKQERIRLSERTVAGLERARKRGRVGGRPRVVTDRAKVAELRAAGKSLGEIAAEMGLAKSTVARIVEETAA